MKNRLIKLTLVILALSVTTSQAKGYLTSLNNPEATITQVFTHGGGEVTLFVTGITQNPDGCDSTSLVHLDGSFPGHERMVAAALTAFTAGKKVGLYSSGCSVIPFWGGTQTRPIINNLWISN